MATLLVDGGSSRPLEPQVGDILAERYQIEEPIGRGGYGRVYRARHLGTGQDVAVKVLLPQPSTDAPSEEFAIKRFFLEARVTSGLKHPHTIKVFDFGQEDTGVVYLAMELLSGRTLREELRSRRKEGRPFTEQEAVEIGIAVTRSLGEAHEAGLVHRDLKPDNVFLHRAGDDEPTVKVLDFGIVKLGDGHNTLSSTTSVPGTPAYMSPEHALNLDVDGRSDLYSLSVILYQLVTLELPFRGPSDPQTLYMHAYQPVPDLASAARTSLSEAFVGVVEAGLAKRASDRFRDARTMREALRACLGGHPVSGVLARAVAPAEADGALPMLTPNADSGMLPTIRRGRPAWERWAYFAGAAGFAVSVGALVITLTSNNPKRVEVKASPPPEPAPPPVAAAPDAGSGPDAAVEAAPPPPPQPKRARKRRRRRVPKQQPLPTKEDRRRKKLLNIRLEDLEKSR